MTIIDIHSFTIKNMHKYVIMVKKDTSLTHFDKIEVSVCMIIIIIV